MRTHSGHHQPVKLPARLKNHQSYATAQLQSALLMWLTDHASAKTSHTSAQRLSAPQKIETQCAFAIMHWTDSTDQDVAMLKNAQRSTLTHSASAQVISLDQRDVAQLSACPTSSMNPASAQCCKCRVNAQTASVRMVYQL